MNDVLEILREKHSNGEELYWILDKLCGHIGEISYRTYFRKRQDAIDALSSILWGYSSKDCLSVLDQIIPK